MEFQSQFNPQIEKQNLLKIILEVIGGVLILSIFLTIAYYGDSISKIINDQGFFEKKDTSEEKELPQVTLPSVLYNLAGSIQQLEAGALILEAQIPQVDENGQVTQKVEIRRVIVAPTTKFSRLTFVSQPGTTQKTPKETAIFFRDLRVKDYIEAVSNKDISQASEFTATQIRVLPK